MKRKYYLHTLKIVWKACKQLGSLKQGVAGGKNFVRLNKKMLLLLKTRQEYFEESFLLAGWKCADDKILYKTKNGDD